MASARATGVATVNTASVGNLANLKAVAVDDNTVGAGVACISLGGLRMG